MVGIPGRGTAKNEWDMQKCERWQKCSKFSLCVLPSLLCHPPATPCRTYSSYETIFDLLPWCHFCQVLLALWVVKVQGASFILGQPILDITAGTEYFTKLTPNVSLDQPSLRSVSKLPILSRNNVAREVGVKTESDHNLMVVKIFPFFFCILYQKHMTIHTHFIETSFQGPRICLCKWGSLELGFISFMVCMGKSFIPCNFSNVSTLFLFR